MNASISILRPRVFEPEELETIGRSFDVVATIIPKDMQTKEVMDSIAKRMLVRFSVYNFTPTEITLDALCWLRWEERMVI